MKKYVLKNNNTNEIIEIKGKKITDRKWKTWDSKNDSKLKYRYIKSDFGIYYLIGFDFLGDESTNKEIEEFINSKGFSIVN